MTTRPNPWIAYRKPNPQARLRLFCFPYAGGGALAYRPWTTEMPAAIEVCPVQLPGREQRLREKPFTRVGPLVEELAQAIAPLLDLPYAFFGHSMGSMIAFETAHHLLRAGGAGPTHLLASARRAPQLPRDDRQYHILPDPEFRAKLREINGTPDEVLQNQELMELVLPLLRSDFELNETYAPSQQPPLACPVTALGGLEDPEVTKEELEAWSEVTRGPFKLRMFPGDHFFLNDRRSALVGVVAESLLR